jgi:hypothetical protein
MQQQNGNAVCEAEMFCKIKLKIIDLQLFTGKAGTESE